MTKTCSHYQNDSWNQIKPTANENTRGINNDLLKRRNSHKDEKRLFFKDIFQFEHQKAQMVVKLQSQTKDIFQLKASKTTLYCTVQT